VILTGQANRDQVVTLSQSPNVAAILAKPWDHDRLFETLDRAARWHAADATAAGK
jgi:hypothetical protein